MIITFSLLLYRIIVETSSHIKNLTLKYKLMIHYLVTLITNFYGEKNATIHTLYVSKPQVADNFPFVF